MQEQPVKENLNPYTEAQYGRSSLLKGERVVIIKVLNMTRTIGDASRFLGISPRNMYRKIVRHKILQTKGQRKVLMPVFCLEETE